jgi:hypothetical protein
VSLTRSSRTQAAALCLSRPVAGLVAALVVVVLEVIEVEHRDAERSAVPPRPSQLAWQLLFPAAPVEEAGQVVRAGHLLEPCEQVGALERHRGLRGEHAHRRRDPVRPVHRMRPADDEHRDHFLVPQDRLEVHRGRAGRRHDPLGDPLVSRASSTKSGFFERKAVPAPETSSPSETLNGGPFWSPWFAVITIAPSGLRSMSLAKRAPVTVQAAEQMISRATLASVVRASSRVASVTAAMLTTSFRVSSWLT